MEHDPIDWPAIVAHADDAELLYVHDRSAWDDEADLHAADYHAADCLIDAAGHVFALTRMGATLSRQTATKAVSVVFTGTDASRRALETAMSLTTDPYKELNILLPAENEAEAVRLQELATMQLGEHAASADFIQLKDGSLNDMLEVLADSNSAVLIVDRDNKMLQAPSLRRSLNNLNCPLLIVR